MIQVHTLPQSWTRLPADALLALGLPVRVCPPCTHALDAEDRPRDPSPAQPTRAAEPRAGPRRSAPSDPRVVVSVAHNPKREGSACRARYDLWRVGATIDDYLAAGGTREDVRWDLRQGFVVAVPPQQLEIR